MCVLSLKKMRVLKKCVLSNGAVPKGQCCTKKVLYQNGILVHTTMNILG